MYSFDAFGTICGTFRAFLGQFGKTFGNFLGISGTFGVIWETLWAFWGLFVAI